MTTRTTTRLHRNTLGRRSFTACLAALLAIALAPDLVQAVCERNSFCCTGGTSDGEACTFDSGCPGGACVFALTVCEGGSNDGSPFCVSDGTCPGGRCAATQKVCGSGSSAGFPCTTSAHCAGGSCVSNGLFCFGGGFNRTPCVSNADCAGEGIDPGTCRAPAAPVPDVFLCSAGGNDGGTCASSLDCPSGACVFAQHVCDGGTVDGLLCQADTDCEPSAPCRPTQKICNAGGSKGFGCLRTSGCSTGTCVSSGRVCESQSEFATLACIDNADCGSNGVCSAPLAVGTPTRTNTRVPTPVFTPTRTHTPGGGVQTAKPTATHGGPGSTPTPCATITKGVCLYVDKNSGCGITTRGRAGGGLLAIAAFLLWIRARLRRAA